MTRTCGRTTCLAITGGSDFHGEGTRRAEHFGVTHLPAEHFDEFLRRTKAPEPNRA
jgi:hypothetical protein